MKLHDKTSLGVFLCQRHEDERPVELGFGCCDGLPLAGLEEHLVDLGIASNGVWREAECVVCGKAAVLDEPVKALGKCRHDIPCVIDGNTACGGKGIDIGIEACGIDVHCLVRTERRDDLCLGFAFRPDLCVVFK